ncbi:hypothetical protein [Methylobacterium indicum]|uniref:Uncharacterized protein n=1 Tax=Methylobacterium indicum TaxID=1775910 RepID=A0A8H8WT01_9HYPH|nr:hypothetical protein [Methylobacterium indicum]BCM83809.1 hypothetical protein mvi_22700 [Methylobacterium indicum]
MRESFASIDRNVYITPSPQAVATLMASHGSEACEKRWHWIDPRTLGGFARTGRALLGQSPGVKRPRSTSPLQEAVGIEAAYALRSRAAGERAAGMGKNLLMYIEQARGLTDLPRADYAERGRTVSLSRAAERGEPGAAEAREAARAFELAVGRVLELALALVPEQPATGRFRLPEPSPALATALAGCERAAVERVLPSLAGPPSVPVPIPSQEPTPMSETSTLPRGGAKRLIPASDAEILRAYAVTPRAPDLADLWGVREGTVYYHLCRLGLTKPYGKTKPSSTEAVPVPASPTQAPVAPHAPAPSQTNVVPFAAHPVVDANASTDSHAPAIVEEPVHSLPAPPRPGYPIHRGRLTVEDLALAVALARRAGLDAQDALEWVRADVAEATYANGRA